MSHIFGLAHTFSGLIDQGSDFLFSRPEALPYQAQGFLTTPPGGGPSVVDDDFGSGMGGNGNGRGAAGCGTCPPGGSRKRFITTICADGSTITREHKSRKRRRRLATASDIKDLSSLATVLKGRPGAFDNWIATRR